MLLISKYIKTFLVVIGKNIKVYKGTLGTEFQPKWQLFVKIVEFLGHYWRLKYRTSIGQPNITRPKSW